MATHSRILTWRIPMDRGAWQVTVHGVTESPTQLSNQVQHSTATPTCNQGSEPLISACGSLFSEMGTTQKCKLWVLTPDLLNQTLWGEAQ